MHSKVLIVVMCILLCSCAATQVRDDVTAEDIQQKAIAVISVSHDISMGDASKAIFYLDRTSVDPGKQLSSIPDNGLFAIASDFADRRGKVYVLDLAPGRHEINTWQMVDRGARFFPKTEPPPLSFDIRTGEAIYLGNIHMVLSTGKNWFGMEMVGDAIPVVQDRSDQDINVALERIPDLRGRIRPSLLPVGLWAAGVGTNRRFDPIPVPVQK